jgi:hypothetical protein
VEACDRQHPSGLIVVITSSTAAFGNEARRFLFEGRMPTKILIAADPAITDQTDIIQPKRSSLGTIILRFVVLLAALVAALTWAWTR